MKHQVFPLSTKEIEALGISWSSNDNYQTVLPTRLRECRKESGVTQPEVAMAIGVTKSAISLYEQGDTVPEIKKLAELANYYGVSTDWLLGRTDIKSPNIDIQTICEKTGLNENSVRTLTSSRQFPEISAYICKFIDTLFLKNSWPDFFPLTVLYSNFLETDRRSPSNKYENKMSDPISNLAIEVELQDIIKQTLDPSAEIIKDRESWDFALYQISEKFKSIIIKAVEQEEVSQNGDNT